MTKLVLDITDIKTYVAIDFIAGFDVLEPFIQDNEFWLMRKYLGKTLLCCKSSLFLYYFFCYYVTISFYVY